MDFLKAFELTILEFKCLLLFLLRTMSYDDLGTDNNVQNE